MERSDTGKTKVVGHINKDALSGGSEGVEVVDEGLGTIVSGGVVVVEEVLALGLGEGFTRVTLGVEMAPADGSVTSGVLVEFGDVSFVVLDDTSTLATGRGDVVEFESEIEEVFTTFFTFFSFKTFLTFFTFSEEFNVATTEVEAELSVVVFNIKTVSSVLEAGVDIALAGANVDGVSVSGSLSLEFTVAEADVEAGLDSEDDNRSKDESSHFLDLVRGFGIKKLFIFY